MCGAIFMDWNCFFQNLPTLGWVFIILLLIFFALFLVGVYMIIKTKDVRLKNFEIVSKVQKEFYYTEGKNILGNQTSNAHNLLKKIWIDIFDVGKKIFNITDQQELFMLEDIARLIEGKLNYEVKNDLTRNHITEKCDVELQRYSDAKASGYYHAVKANLYSYNVQLPKYNLPEIMETITLADYKRIFGEIYFNARKIAGGKSDD